MRLRTRATISFVAIASVAGAAGVQIIAEPPEKSREAPCLFGL